MLLGNAKLYTIKIFISKALMDLYITYDEVILINNVLKEYNEMKE